VRIAAIAVATIGALASIAAIVTHMERGGARRPNPHLEPLPATGVQHPHVELEPVEPSPLPSAIAVPPGVDAALEPLRLPDAGAKRR
jgi:hypothetical protein